MAPLKKSKPLPEREVETKGQHWLVKQEPTDYSWTDLVREGGTAWTGVRNNAARLHLRSMRRGDLVLVYHSGDEKLVVGVARVTQAAYPDPTAEEGGWVAVDLAPVQALSRPISLRQIKADEELRTMDLVRQSRLSVSPVGSDQFKKIINMATLA